MRVANDGQRFSESSADFTYFTSPEVHSVEPSAGDRTRPLTIHVSGEHFFALPPKAGMPHSIYCKFGAEDDAPTTVATYVDASTIACPTVAVDYVRSVPVVVSVNRGHTFSNAETAPLFTFYEPDTPPVISSVQPVYGPLSGGEPNTVCAAPGSCSLVS